MADELPPCGAEKRHCTCGHHQQKHQQVPPEMTRRGRCLADGCACEAFAGIRCERPGDGAGGRCKSHGGLSLEGAANGMYRGGVYRAVLKGKVRKLYDRIMADEQMLSLREEIATMRALAVDLASRQRDLSWGAPAAGRSFERVEALWKSLKDIDSGAPVRRASPRERGYNRPEWTQFREQWLVEHPLCGDRDDGSSSDDSQCARRGMATPATDVDHIIRVTGPDDPRFFDTAAVQSLCHACHSAKTQLERAAYEDAPPSARRAALMQRLDKAMADLREACDAAEGERKMRAEFRQTAETLERLARSENTRVVELYSMISAERAFAMRQSETQILLDALESLVQDRELRNAIRRRVAHEFAKLAGRSSTADDKPVAELPEAS